MNKRQKKKFKKKGYHKKCGYSFVQEIIDIIKREPYLIFKTSSTNPKILLFNVLSTNKTEGLMPEGKFYELDIEFRETPFVSDELNEKADMLRRQYEKSFDGIMQN